MMEGVIPPTVDPYFDMIQFGAEGQFLLGTSSLNKRSWTGDIWWFPSPAEAPLREKARSGYRIDSGIVKGKYIGNNQILLGLDSGGVQIANCKTSKLEDKDIPFYFFEMNPPICEHDDSLTDLDTWKTELEGENAFVTVGMDGRAVVWDKNMFVLHTYHPAHSSGIVSVTCHPTDKNKFATAGLDGTIKVWNTSESKPCSTLYCDPDLPPSVISWNPSLPQYILVATRTGSVFNLDTSTKTISAPFSVGDREIKNVSWCPDRPSLCGVCGDDVPVTVLNVQEQSIQVHYSDSSHRDYVRGLAWEPKTGKLYSCGWDQLIKEHNIP